jgi:2,5-diketo-D-gluconate reductase B
MRHLDLIGGGRMPVIGLGTWQMAGDACVRAVRRALELGYRHIDTASFYRNEAEVGAALRASGVPREAIFVTTKVWPSDFAPAALRASAERSLKALRLDHVDLLLLHWPSQTVPLADTLGALEGVRAKGQARAIGISNFPVKLMREAVETHGAAIACNQVELHVLNPQPEILAYARPRGIAVTAYSPLARGALLRNRTLAELGRKHGKTPSQVALRWLLEEDGVAVIPKASSEAHLKANLELFDFTLDDADRAALQELA